MSRLLVIVGPTGVGKTEWSMAVAERLNSPIISADSRQIYRGMNICTAAPTEEQLNRIDHYFVGILSPEEYYSAGKFERNVLSLLEELHKVHQVVVMEGGSMLYIDAVCRGIDNLPKIDERLRKDIWELYRKEGLDPIRKQLKILDPQYYRWVDLKNPKRVIHAVEICLMSGKPYSSLRRNIKKKRPFHIVKVGFRRNRDELYERINLRVDKMMQEGLLEEARGFYSKRDLNSLNTVGYKELFSYFDGDCTLDFAVEKIKQHSRNYARKQMTWFNRDKDIHWIDLSNKNHMDIVEEILSHLWES